MPRMPGAIWKPITAPKGRRPMPRPVRVNHHIAVSEAASLHGYFNQTGIVDSHFYVRRDGTIEQYVDTSMRSFADLEGNPDTISVETQGGLTGADSETWTPQQVEALARIDAWAHNVHGIPLRLAQDSRPGPSSHGLSWHRLGIDGTFPPGLLHGRVPGGLRYSNSRGKRCPGDARIRQMPAVLARAETLAGGAPSRPPAGDVTRLQECLALLGHYTGLIDGDPGPMTVAAVTDYQNTNPALSPDGWAGPLTITHLEADVTSIVDELKDWLNAVLINGYTKGPQSYPGMAAVDIETQRRITEANAKIDVVLDAVKQFPGVDADALADALAARLEKVRAEDVAAHLEVNVKKEG